MPNVDINGTVVDFPDGLSSDDLNKAVSTAASQMGGSKSQPSMLAKGLANYASFMGPEGGYGGDPAGKFMSYVKKPFNKGGQMLTEALGKKQVNPYLSAAAGTAVQMAPDIATTLGPGAPKEVPNNPGELTKGLMGQLESASGSMKGSLESAYKDPSLIFSKGESSAKPLYEAAKADLPYEQTIFKGLAKHGDIVDKAIETLDKGGKLEPQEALISRKSLDKVRKTFSSDAFDFYRKSLDSMAKADENIAKADPKFLRGMKASSLRTILPQNKLGGASPFKTAVGMAMGPFGAPVLSPAVQGVGATVAGIGAKLTKDPQLLTAVMDFIRKREQGQQ